VGIKFFDSDIVGAARSEAMFRGLLESTPDAVVIANRDGTIVLVNSRTEELFGHTRSEMLGKPVNVLIPERFQEQFAACLSAASADRDAASKVAGLEMDGRHKNGSVFPVELSLSSLWIESGIIVFCTLRDISARRRSVEALRESEDRFHSAFEHTIVAMMLSDLDNRFVRVNAAFARLFGYSALEMLEMHMDEITHPADLVESHARRVPLLAGEICFF
jgi:PAS domain S-box-containing protein